MHDDLAVTYIPLAQSTILSNRLAYPIAKHQKHNTINFKGNAGDSFTKSATNQKPPSNSVYNKANYLPPYLGETKPLAPSLKPAGFGKVTLDNVKLKDEEMYNTIVTFLDQEDQTRLAQLKQSGRLTTRESDDSSSALENLYKILSEPRSKGLDAKLILKDTITALLDPYTITQKFGKLDGNLANAVLQDSTMTNVTPPNGIIVTKHKVPDKITKDMLYPKYPGTCNAASVQFSLAYEKPAEYTRYVAALTSPSLSVKENVRTKDLSPDIVTTMSLLEDFGAEYHMDTFDNFTVTMRPDRAAIVRAIDQTKKRERLSRSPVDVLMQSTFMQYASANSYNTLLSMRTGGFNTDNDGLTSFEHNFLEATVNDTGGKTSVDFMITDDKGYVTNYSQPESKTLQMILDSLKTGTNVIIGYVEVGHDKKILGPGHIITIVGTRQDKNGELIFIANDTDDYYNGAIEYKAKELLPKIHHAAIPNTVLKKYDPKFNEPVFDLVASN